MKNTVIVFGLGKFGKTVATKLHDQGIEVMAVDKNYDLIQEVANRVTVAVQCDFMDEDAMAELGISNFDMAVVSTGQSLEASIAATMAAKDNGVAKVIAKATSINQARILEKLGANQIIFPEMDMGERLARSIAGSNLLEFIHFSNEYGMIEVKARKEWIGRSLEDMDFRNTYHMNIVGIERQQDYIVTPRASEIIKEGDVLVLIGKEEHAHLVETK